MFFVTKLSFCRNHNYYYSTLHCCVLLMQNVGSKKKFRSLKFMQLHDFTQHCFCSQEKRRARSAQEMKKKADIKYSSLQEEGVKLQNEIATLRSQLKASKKRIQKLELSETQFAETKADLEREQASYQSELENLNKMLETTQAQLTREMEIRHRTERDIITAKTGMFV